MVVNVVRKRLWWLRFPWFRSDHFQGLKFVFAVDQFESLKLAVADHFRNDGIAKDDIDAPGRVHADFKSFSKQDVAGEEIRVYLGYAKYLVKSNQDNVAALVFSDDMDAPGGDSMELSVRSVDFDGLIEFLVVSHDVFVWRKML
jgi:hypothetical protein